MEEYKDQVICLDMDTFNNMLKQPELRDQFAMAALKGMNLPYMDIVTGFNESAAERAYELADAMMAARNKNNEN
jgi:hypothetical protein